MSVLWVCHLCHSFVESLLGSVSFMPQYSCIAIYASIGRLVYNRIPIPIPCLVASRIRVFVRLVVQLIYCLSQVYAR